VDIVAEAQPVESRLALDYLAEDQTTRPTKIRPAGVERRNPGEMRSFALRIETELALEA